MLLPGRIGRISFQLLLLIPYLELDRALLLYQFLSHLQKFCDIRFSANTRDDRGLDLGVHIRIRFNSHCTWSRWFQFVIKGFKLLVD